MLDSPSHGDGVFTIVKGRNTESAETDRQTEFAQTPNRNDSPVLAECLQLVFTPCTKETTTLTVTETPANRRAEASRRNGRLGGHKKTAEGRLRSSLNAATFGLFAKTFPLPHEDQAAVAARGELWQSYYDPQSPAACHMSNECARATILSDRCDRYRQATLEEQARDTQARWKRKQRDKTYRLVKRLATDPAAAMADLQSFSYGLKWIINEYTTLIECIDMKGHLNQEEIDQAIRLYAVEPVPERITRHLMAYRLYTYHLGCALGVSAEEMGAWVATANRPEEMRGLAHDEVVPLDATWAAGMLVDTFEQEIDRLEAEEDRVWNEEDGPSLQRKLEGASILTEEAARRVTRSHAESRTTFHRYWPALKKTLKTDAEERPAEAPAVISEPTPQAGADRAQIEPSLAPDETAQVAEETRGSGETPPRDQERRGDAGTGAGEAANRAEPRGPDESELEREAAGALAVEWVVDGSADRPQVEPSLATDKTAQVADQTRRSGAAHPPAQERRAGPASAGAGGRPVGQEAPGKDGDDPRGRASPSSARTASAIRDMKS